MHSSTASVTGIHETALHRATLTLRPNVRRSHVPGSRVSRRAEHETGRITFRSKGTAPQPIRQLQSVQ